jgi:AraC-like DNA-binding protein
MSSAPDVRTSLIDLVNAHHMNARGAITYLITLRDTALMGYGIHLSDVVAHDQIADLIMALGWNYLSELADVQPCEILLARAAPSDLRPYRRVFACPIRFEAEQTALVLPLSALARPNFGADAATHAEMQRHISRVWADREPIVRTRLLRLLWPRVVMLSPRVEEMAGRLAMHSRTLNRRLHLEGTSYREVLNEARREIACQLLAHTHLGVTQIALALGYDDPNAFTHAFSRWTGLSPSDWRATPQSDPSQNAVRQTSPAEPPVVDLAVSGDMQN